MLTTKVDRPLGSHSKPPFRLVQGGTTYDAPKTHIDNLFSVFLTKGIKIIIGGYYLLCYSGCASLPWSLN